jgi:putative transposase
MDGGLSMVRERGNGPKTRSVVYRWTNEAGWVTPTSYEVMKMRAVNHKPMNRPGKPLPFRAGRRSETN